MKCRAIFGSIDSKSVSAELIRKLEEIHPMAELSRYYRAEVDYPSSEYDSIQSLLDSHSFEIAPRWGDVDYSRHYTLVIHREYSTDDIAHSELLRIRPIGQGSFGLHLANQTKLDEHGVMLVGKQLLKKYDTILAPRKTYYPDWAFVPDQLRKVIEQGKFDGLVFDPTSVVEGNRDEHTDPLNWDDYPERWWLLSSDRSMPKLAPGVELVSTNGKPYKDDFSEGCGVLERPYGQPELHYQRSDLEAFGSFDAAKTHECFGGPRQKDGQALIVSNRFYQFCVDNNIECGWQPVRIDEE